ncbi:membrane fusion protein, adhesin transport system [Oceanospirillum multiglobuliferum]|uniref:HlyD family type I secretion periplasmic adaptor subunit n=1 Tax=Oceanospirillum multiglobuliferum TaxID=64969 RepID=UPI000999AF28|nr:HlyD family type I secretion periplasmic adaptor subunit [Oceanospirillum multiglobuliferum]SKA12859.1 membrane fusion protein, adhesin transport system [Oceanospirillum multiglobuliferum]
MLLDSFFSSDHQRSPDQHSKLESYHKRHYSAVLLLLLAGFIGFVAWANSFYIDQVARATGEVISSSRVQIIQAVDAGVLSQLNVREGDQVKAGQVLAQFDQVRLDAYVKEIEARYFALKAKAVRLRAEVTGQKKLVFPAFFAAYSEQVQVEQALFEQRRTGLNEELRVLNDAIELAREEVSLVKKLSRSGDVNRSEVIRVERALNETETKYIVRKNRYLEESSTELTKVENEIAQNEQILTQRKQQLDDSVFTAPVSGIVKNIRVTTVGGVLRAGEELMQIIPVDEDLVIEAKVSPVDIALVRSGLETTIRFDPFDYTIYGGVQGEVIYVSADTLKEESAKGEEIYYRVHVSFKRSTVTTTGRSLEILPGMTAQLDIKTGERTVMEYLLKPLRKTLSEAFGER